MEAKLVGRISVNTLVVDCYNKQVFVNHLTSLNNGAQCYHDVIFNKGLKDSQLGRFAEPNFEMLENGPFMTIVYNALVNWFKPAYLCYSNANRAKAAFQWITFSMYDISMPL